MLPFPIMNTYGNIIPPSVQIIDMDAYTNYVAILSSDGRLYTSSATLFGSNTDGSWTLSRSDVIKMYCTWTAILVETSNNEFYYIGTNIFSTTRNTTRSSVWVNCTSTMNTISISNKRKILIDTNNVFVLLNDGTIQCIGYGGSGTFGTGSTTGSSTFVQSNITGITDIQLTSTSSEAVLLAYNGSTTRLFGCGQSYNSVLGSGGSSAAVVSSWFTVVSSCSEYKTASVRNIAYKVGSTWYERGTSVSGYSWGTNQTGNSGGFGNPHTLSSNVSLSTYYNQYELSATFSVGTDGNLYVSGLNQFGSLGIGSTTNQLVPTGVINFATPSNIKIIKAYSFNSFILTVGGLLYYCGRNNTSLPTGISGNITQFTMIQLPQA